MAADDLRSGALSRRRFLTMVGIGSGAALLAACQPSAPAAVISSSAPAPTPSARTDPNATINYAISGEPIILDPGNTGAAQTHQITHGIFDNLTNLADDYTALPGLATSWSTSADRLTWTFKLRKGAQFHDGEPVDADAVKFTMERVMDAKQNLSGIRYLSPILKGVSAPAPDTVEFTLKQPYGAMPLLMATEATAIVSPKAAKASGQDFGRKPVGSGPYVFKEWLPGQKVTIERNDKYWGDKAKNQRVVFFIVKEDSTRVAMVETGQADIAQYVPPSDAQRLRGDAKFQVLQTEALEVRTLKFNMLDERVKDPRVRQAMNMALDRDQLVATVLENTASPAVGPLPKGVPGAFQTAKYKFDLAQARKLLADANYPSGQKLTIAYTPSSTGSSQQEIMAAIQSQLKNAGVDVVLQSFDTAAYATYRALPATGTAGQGKGFISHGQTLAYPDPWLIRNTYHSDAWPPAGGNYGFYKNPKVDQLLDQAQSEADPAKRNQLFTDFQNLVLDDAPALFLYQQRWLYLMRGLRPISLPSTELIEFASVEKIAA